MFVMKAGVVGAGTMGAEIAQAITFSDLPVTLVDVSSEAAEKGRQRVQAIYDRRVEKSRMTPSQAQDRMSLLTVTTDMGLLKDADLVIEAVPERMDLKKQVMAALGQVVSPVAVIGSNTSALSISEMASATPNPGRVLGLHFFFPASVMRLVEVVEGRETDAEALDTALRFVEDLRKIPVRVKECPGFLVNRILMAGMVEILRFQDETGLAPEEIDRAAVSDHLAPMGPFGLADSLGLDIVHEVQRTLEEGYGDRFSVPSRLGEMVAAGHLGAKSGQGFYTYTGGNDRG